MAAKKKPKHSTTCVCVVTGREFEYRGWGRPPKYHPEERDAIVKAQRKQARIAEKAKRSAKELAPV